MTRGRVEAEGALATQNVPQVRVSMIGVSES